MPVSEHLLRSPLMALAVRAITGVARAKSWRRTGGGGLGQRRPQGRTLGLLLLQGVL